MTVTGLHPSLQLAWGLANGEAILAGSQTIEPLHFLEGVLIIAEGSALPEAQAIGLGADAVKEVMRVAGEARAELGMPRERMTAMRRELTGFTRRAGQASEFTQLHRSGESRALFDEAVRLAIDRGDDELDMLHLLDAILSRVSEDAGVPAGAGAGVRLRAVADHLVAQSTSKESVARAAPPAGGGPSVLAELGRDLTALAREGRIQPLVGRKKELTVLARHLQRTTKRNVLIIGEAGVGKTALVEGFAQRIATGDVPDFLLNLKIVQISVSDLIAGTQYRGDMETRIKRVIAEAAGDPNVVIFLDEVHLVVASGVAGGSLMDVAGMLKPALSRDDFRCIGATTVDEYERHIKNDTAFLRRFQLLRVAQPTRDEAVEVCRAWARRIERVQDVTFAEGAVAAAVDLSLEYIMGRSLPDKAIDLLENAAVLVKLGTLSRKSPLPAKKSPAVTRDHVVTAIEEQYGVSVGRSGFPTSAEIEAALREFVVGQDQAITQLALEFERIRRDETARTGPLGVFMFTGPTGTGKTLTAESLGRILCPMHPHAVARYNMNEFKERHEMSRLFGAPPGLVGHDQPGTIFRFAETNPQGVIILDEMEKAHPDVQDYFLQIFDKGEALDSRGRRADFRPYVFVLTCNLAAGGGAGARVGFAHAETAPTETLRGSSYGDLPRYFRREFLARIDKVVGFRAIDREGYLVLLERRFTGLADRTWRETSVTLRIAEGAKEQFVALCLGQPDGCRGFERLFDRLIAVPIADRLAGLKSGRVVMLAGLDQVGAVFGPPDEPDSELQRPSPQGGESPP